MARSTHRKRRYGAPAGIRAASPKGWRAKMSAAGDVIMANVAGGAGLLGTEDLKRATASELYPDVSWPPTKNSPQWQHDVWKELDQTIGQQRAVVAVRMKQQQVME